MKRLRMLALVSASASAMACAAAAQNQSPPGSAAATTNATAPSAPAATASNGGAPVLGEVIVTARRRSESLQNVPETVDVVSSGELQKLNIREFQDIQTVVPGLSLQSDSTGFSAAASLRGVTFNVDTGAQPTVALYLNEAPVQALLLFQSLYDVGQVETLKGPQGTTRGISAPSGAITVTTTKPNLEEFGGYADTTIGERDARNVQGAINIPIIKDVLAVRIAAVFDQNEADDVRSIHNDARPYSRTPSERISLEFKPNDRIEGNITYQHLDHHLQNYTQVSGPGPGTALDPPITPEQRLSVQDDVGEIHQHCDVVTGQLNGQLLGQRLSYIGSYQHLRITTSDPQDFGDVVPGVDINQLFSTTQVQTTQEVRLSSEPRAGRLFDYAIGGFYNYQNTTGQIDAPGPLLPGAFGPGLGPANLSEFNPSYQIPITINNPSQLQETSIYANATVHLPFQTDLSGGIRHIWSIVKSETEIRTGNGLINLGGVPCSALGFTNGSNPGDCILPAAAVAANDLSRTSETPTVYDITLSHHVTRNLLVYFTTGTSYRPPVSSVGIQGDLVSSTIPVLHDLTFHPSEHSQAYEVGLKSTWLNGRARFNASMFRQDFTNLTIYVPGVDYFNTTTNAVNNFSFTASTDALVQGFDLDGALQITPHWTVSAQASYADAKVEGSQVPCNITSNGQPVFNTAGLVSLCAGGAASQLPLWNATFQSEYDQPLTADLEGFLRLLGSYYPTNRNRVETDFTVNSYSLINLYLGVRSRTGAWEAYIFARNAFNTQRALDVQNVQENLNSELGTAFTGLIHPSGYYQSSETAPKEVGISLHYAFGSR